MALAAGAAPPGTAFHTHPALATLRLSLGGIWIAFQLGIIFWPQAPMVERPLHLALAMAILFLWMPLPSGPRPLVRVALDSALLVAAAGVGFYYLLSARRLTERMEGVDPVSLTDVLFGVAAVAVLIEGVRRAVGWPLVGVIVAFLLYGFSGAWMPGWLRFSGFAIDEAVEILTLSLNGVLGITTATSVQFVFYFILFGALYSAVGGGQLVIDIGLRVAGRHSGGSAKAAVVSSSLMGSITGSAVANVAGTGVFTIPLMRRAGYSKDTAGALEAIASTGGQLMPPVMGVAAFVMAEMLQVDYGQVALAAALPAGAFYAALFLGVDLQARKTGIGTLPPDTLEPHPPILRRLYLLVPPALLVGCLVSGFSAAYSAVLASLGCVAVSFAKRETWLVGRRLVGLVEAATRQASQVAVPIAAIGIIIAVAIQSNLALKFSAQLIGGSGSQLGAMALVVLGCLVMGLGLPTVAAYMIGAILFVPALRDLGIEEMPAHFFVMYYCVLSMVTPPVALASYAAAGISGGSAMRTSTRAFRAGLVCFLIPFAFAFEPRLLVHSDPVGTVVAGLALVLGTCGWAIALSGYWLRPLLGSERIAFAVASAVAICLPTGSDAWNWSVTALLAVGAWTAASRNRLPRQSV